MEIGLHVLYNSGSNQASDFKSAECIAQGWFEITSMTTPELYNTKSCITN